MGIVRPVVRAVVRPIVNKIDSTKSSGISWSSYWNTLISATVENAAPTDVVMTFPTAKAELTDTDFTIAGKTISGAVWAGAVLTLTVTVAFVYGDAPVVTFVPSGGTANVTNNILATAELTTYITGLATPLSLRQRRLLNEFIKTLKTGLSITDLDDAFDTMYVLGGETAESSLKNLVKNANHATAVNSPTFTQFEGFTGDGISMYINTNYKAETNGVNFTRNNASIGLYNRLNIDGEFVDAGSYDAATSTISIMCRNATKAHGRVNNITATYVSGDVADALGLCICTRNGAAHTDMVLYKNKTSLTTITGINNTTARNDIDISILNITGLSYYSTRQIAFFFMGKHITTAMRDVIVDSVEAYMDANGKGVIA